MGLARAAIVTRIGLLACRLKAWPDIPRDVSLLRRVFGQLKRNETRNHQDATPTVSDKCQSHAYTRFRNLQ
jgi:hypothetical protein